MKRKRYKITFYYFNTKTQQIEATDVHRTQLITPEVLKNIIATRIHHSRSMCYKVEGSRSK